MADTPLAAARKFHTAAARLEGSSKKAEEAAALFVKQTILSVSPSRLRNVGKRGAKLGVGYRPAQGSGTLVAARGPWQIIERDTKAHLIGGGRSEKTEKRSYIQYATGDIRLGPVQHPGTTGKHTFEKGVDLARPGIPRIIDASVKTTLVSVFGF